MHFQLKKAICRVFLTVNFMNRHTIDSTSLVRLHHEGSCIWVRDISHDIAYVGRAQSKVDFTAARGLKSHLSEWQSPSWNDNQLLGMIINLSEVGPNYHQTLPVSENQQALKWGSVISVFLRKHIFVIVCPSPAGPDASTQLAWKMGL